MSRTVPNATFLAEVLRVKRLTPGLVRVTLGGDGLADFRSTGVGDEYLRVFFPHTADRRLVSVPEAVGESGWEYPDGVEPAPMRTYTVRDSRPGEIDIDFVVHQGGVAAGWARVAGPGDVVGLNSPTGLYDPPADLRWQLLVGDQAALPAVWRLIDNLPASVRTRVLVEVPGEAYRIAVPAGAESAIADGRLTVQWYDGGNGHGPSTLAGQVRDVLDADDLAAGLPGGYVWVAGETKCLRDVRRFLRRESGLPASRYKVVGYWTADAEQYRQKYESLDESVRKDLMAVWDSDRDREEIEDDYIERLEKLGL